MPDLAARIPRPRIGLLPTGHYYYWDQFPELRSMGMRMFAALRERLERIGDVIAPDLVDTPEKSEEAGKYLARENVDILLIFPFGYTPGMCIVPAVRKLDVPVRILNAHEDASYDYASADTTLYLHHEGVCCIPEYASALKSIGRPFRVRTGPFRDERLWREVEADCRGTATARAFRDLSFGVIGETYTSMTDMPVDEQRLLASTGRLLKRPEVEEIEEAAARVTDDQLAAMLAEFRSLYDVEPSVTDDHLRESARLAVAYEEVILRHDISAFGFYWWGEKPEITRLRSEAALAVSRLAAMGRPGVTEGDVKTAMAMKVLDLLGAGGMFVEFFGMDFDEDFLLLGHDGPANIAMASRPPRLQHLAVHHGKSGEGIGIDFDIAEGPVTLLNLTQVTTESRFKLTYAVAEVIPGPILQIGNPNCRVRLQRPIHEFMDAWCQEGPGHHIAMGRGNVSAEIEAYAEAMGFPVVHI